MGEALKKPLSLDPFGLFKTGRSAAKRAQKEQTQLISKQRQADELKLAEEEDVIGRKKLLASSGRAGRRSLIRTSETGTKSTNLGGTT